MDIPQGYKLTELGVIPEDWEVKQISDFTSIITGGTPSTQLPEYWGGNIMWMSSGELNKKFVFDVEGRITTEGLLNSSTHIIPPFCVLIGLAGQGKTRGTAAYNYISLCTNQSIAAILPNDEYDSLYLYYVVDSKYDYLRLLSSGDGGRGGLNKNLLNSLEISFPKTIAEQRAIAEALSDIDGLIEALDKKIAKKRLLKHGAMQQLLTGKKRLPGFTDPWVEKKLGEIGVLAMCKRVFQEETSEKGDIPFYKIGTFGHQADAYISVEKYEQLKQMYRFPKKGDILISAAGTIGRTVVYDGKPAYFQDSNIIWLDHNEKQIVNSFLYFLYQVVEWNTENTTIARLYNDNFNNMTIRFPISIEEQNAIATVLSGMDKEIESLEARRDKYRLLKSGMMQKLLTGQIRLTKPQTKIVPMLPEAFAAREIPVDAHILAGHIVNRLWQSKGWGRTKLQKSLHLIGYCVQLNLGYEYIRNTAGPDDQLLMNYIDQKFKQYQHVNIVKERRMDGTVHYSYIPTPLMQELEMAYKRYPEDTRKHIDELLDKLSTMNLSGAEILSTLYAVWNNRIIKGEQVTDDFLLADFYAWSKHKADFEERRVRKALDYMRKENIVPIGWGKYIDKK